MSNRIWSAAAVALLAVPLVAGAGVLREAVHGKLAAVAQDGAERGRFRLLAGDRGNGSHFEKIEAQARRLDPAIEYHVFLITSGATATADFGAMHVRTHGVATFRFNTKFDTMPAGVTTLTDFGGGTIEIRDGSTAVLSATVPSWDGASTFGHDRAALKHVDNAFAGRGEMIARRQNVPSGVREEFRLTCGRMDNGATYTAYAIASDLTETQLGTFTTSDPLGRGGFRLATAKGDTIPGGGVLALAGQTVEVRDAGGIAVLTGTFPTIP